MYSGGCGLSESVMDTFSRKIVGCHVHESLRTESVAYELFRVVSKRYTERPLILRLDRGSQIRLEVYQALHAKCDRSFNDRWSRLLPKRNGRAVQRALRTKLLHRLLQDVVWANKRVNDSVVDLQLRAFRPVPGMQASDAVHGCWK